MLEAVLIAGLGLMTCVALIGALRARSLRQELESERELAGFYDEDGRSLNVQVQELQDELDELHEQLADFARVMALPVYDPEALETALWERAAQGDEQAEEILHWRWHRCHVQLLETDPLAAG